MAIGDPKAADFGVTLGCDCWESLTTPGSGVSIVMNLATSEGSGYLKKKCPDEADRIFLCQSVGHHARMGISSSVLAVPERRDAADERRRHKKRGRCRLWSELARNLDLDIWGIRKEKLHTRLPFLGLDCRRLTHRRREGRWAGIRAGASRPAREGDCTPSHLPCLSKSTLWYGNCKFRRAVAY